MGQTCAPDQLVQNFADACHNVLATMADIQVTLDSPRDKVEPQPTYDVSAIVGFSGDVLGSVVVSFSREAAIGIVEAFAGEHFEPNEPNFADAVGELGNMIAGNAKKEFGCNASISVPSVIIGPGHTIARLRDVPCVVIPGSCAAGNFALEINIKPNA
jgi:chemotaxis protein CheX